MHNLELIELGDQHTPNFIVVNHWAKSIEIHHHTACVVGTLTIDQASELSAGLEVAIRELTQRLEVA